MADLTPFLNAEVGIIKNTPPTPTFRFKPGQEVGEADLLVREDETIPEALNRWAADLLGLDAGAMSVLEVLEVRAWGHNPETGNPYRWVKAAVARQSLSAATVADAASRWLDRGVKRSRALSERPRGIACAAWWPVADTQLGKGGDERFGGLSDTMARLDWAVSELADWTVRQRKHGWSAERVVIPLAGDLTEGVCGSYDSQEFHVTLNAADQLELAIAAVERLVDAASTVAPEVVLTGVASNHDRQSKRGSGDNMTDAWDDRTFVLLRTLSRVFTRVGRQVTVLIPSNPHVSVVDDGHLTVATIHGHKPKFAQSAANTMWRWWAQEIANKRDASAAHVLLAAHYHHPYSLQQSGRLLVGLPSMDQGSAWFESGGGDWSLPGVRPFLTTKDGVRELDLLMWPEDVRAAREQTGGLIA